MAETTAVRRGWLRRNWRWFFPVLLVGILAAGAAGYGLSLRHLRAKHPYPEAFDKVVHNAKLIEAIGEPLIEPLWPPPRFQDDQSIMTVRFRVVGPRGEAAIEVKGRSFPNKNDSGVHWGLTTLRADVKRIVQEDLTIDVGPSPDDAPLFDPKAAGPSGATSQPAEGKLPGGKQDQEGSPTINLDVTTDVLPGDAEKSK